MRHLFLMLVLVNLGFAAWSAWVAPSAHSGRPADEGLPALTLVSELPADLRSAEVANQSGPAAQNASAPIDAGVAPGAAANREPDPVPVPAPGGDTTAAGELAAADIQTRCTSVGPFRDLSQAAAAAATLRNAGYQPT